jgi:hypothetical protein
MSFHAIPPTSVSILEKAIQEILGLKVENRGATQRGDSMVFHFYLSTPTDILISEIDVTFQPLHNGSRTGS